MISSLHGPFDDRIYWKEAISLRKHGFEVIHLCAGRMNNVFLSPEGIRIIEIKKPRYARNPYIDILLAKLLGKPHITESLLKVCRSVKADVYHLHDQQINKIGQRLRNLPHHPRIIYDVHEDYRDQFITYHRSFLLAPFAAWHARRIRRRELKMAGKYDAVIAAVPHIAGIFKEHVSRSVLHVVYNYTTLFPRKVPPPEKRSWDAVYTGLINDSRSGLEMVEAAALVRNHIPAFRMLLVGPVVNASYRKMMEDRIIRLGLQENVILKEEVPYSEMEGILMDSRVGLGLFKPLGIFRYGIQVKTFEYMACGLPVICSHTGSINDIVTASACGLSVDPSSATGTADALVRMLTDRDLWMTCSMNGRTAVRDKYNWAGEEKKLIEVYERMLSGEGATSGRI